MANFSSWWTSYRKTLSVRQVTWLCGDERILVEDTVQTIKTSLAPDPWNFVPLVVGVDSERTIWAELDQYPVGGTKRLVVIRSAEKLKQPERLTEFVARRTENPNTYVVFVSHEARIPHLEPTDEERRGGQKGAVVPYLSLGAKGHVIECRAFTQATAKHAVAWVMSKNEGMKSNVASYLLERANGDLRLVRDVCVKLDVFPDAVSITTINALLAESPRDTFVDALLALDRKTALLALSRMATSDYSRTIGFLDAQLDLAGMVHDMLIQHKTQSEIARAAGNKNFLVADLMGVAKHYDPKRRLLIRKLLATADENIRQGVREGILEALVVLW